MSGLIHRLQRLGSAESLLYVFGIGSLGGDNSCMKPIPDLDQFKRLRVYLMQKGRLEPKRTDILLWIGLSRFRLEVESDDDSVWAGQETKKTRPIIQGSFDIPRISGRVTKYSYPQEKQLLFNYVWLWFILPVLFLVKNTILGMEISPKLSSCFHPVLTTSEAYRLLDASSTTSVMFG